MCSLTNKSTPFTVCVSVFRLSSFVRPGHSPDSRWRCPLQLRLLQTSGFLHSRGVIVLVRPWQGSANQAAMARRCQGWNKPRRRPACSRRTSDTRNVLEKRCSRGTARRPTEYNDGLVSRCRNERAAMRGNSQLVYYCVRGRGEGRRADL